MSAHQEAREKALKARKELLADPPTEARAFIAADLTGFRAGLDAGWSAAIDAAAKAADQVRVRAESFGDAGIGEAVAAGVVAAAIRALDATPTTENRSAS